jgi:S1-C subfamily serine protease
MDAELFLEQKTDIPPLMDALRRFATAVSVADELQNVLINADLDDAFMGNLKWDTNANMFAQALLAKFRTYHVSKKRLDYHPMVNLLQNLLDFQPYDLTDNDVTLFTRLIERGNENFKALTARRAVGRIESPKGTGVGTGTLVGKNLLLTCYHIFSKNLLEEAWVRFDYTAGSYGLEDVFKLDMDFVSNQNQPDHALLQIKGNPEPQPTPPVNAILNQNQEIRLIHHPGGQPVVISDVGQIAQVGEDYIDHDVDTESGSSGAPIFNRNWEMVGIHQGNPGIARPVEPGTTAGVPIRAIWDKISPHISGG